MIIEVSEQSKFIYKKEGCATTDNMFRMAFHARKYIPLIQIIVKLALRLSLTAIGSTEETILLVNNNMLFWSFGKARIGGST